MLLSTLAGVKSPVTVTFLVRKREKTFDLLSGVTSFTTDLTTKKVTVTGDLTPASVLNSISKVKKAQFWPSS
ncbi:hypothetical protein KSP40_PGU011500 [Platanthera guangdongensis]|uniref:HMA domain-containing protein n=1 Tax=Platanthera guangdongensis TaxID=2320717 RepID=A0ABR2M7L9_9ASPA